MLTDINEHFDEEVRALLNLQLNRLRHLRDSRTDRPWATTRKEQMPLDETILLLEDLRSAALQMSSRST